MSKALKDLILLWIKKNNADGILYKEDRYGITKEQIEADDMGWEIDICSFLKNTVLAKKKFCFDCQEDKDDCEWCDEVENDFCFEELETEKDSNKKTECYHCGALQEPIILQEMCSVCCCEL